MSSPAKSLNLNPQERRVAAVIGLILFIFLNVWLVWPHFGDWRRIQGQRAQAESTLQRYQEKIRQVPEYERRQRFLENQGQSVASDEQELDFVRKVQELAVANGVNITRNDPRPKTTGSTTNQFFEEQSITIEANSGPSELVRFFESLATTNSLIRVREMTLKPDQAQTRLNANLTLVASYQKKAVAKNAPAATATSAPVPATGARTNMAVSRTNSPVAGAVPVRPKSTNAAPARPGSGDRPASGSTNRIVPKPSPTPTPKS